MKKHNRNVSLWTCLHDANMENIVSDRFERSVCCTFNIGYISSHHNMPDNTQFILRLSEVTSVLAKVWASWPGELNLNGIDNEQRSQLIDDYNKKGRMESITWSDFETNIIEYSCDILNADLVVNDGSVIFSFEGLCDDIYYDAKVSAGQISVSYNGINATIEEFLSLGDAYWTAFANRRNQRDQL